MSHFAKIENSIVTEVIVAEQDYIDTLEGQWVQTSYNANIRKNFAGIGYTYDLNRDAFIPPKAFNSWVLNEDTCLWEAPVPYPTDLGTPENPKSYSWDEATISWKEQE
jgi:hypothetical protein